MLPAYSVALRVGRDVRVAASAVADRGVPPASRGELPAGLDVVTEDSRTVTAAAAAGPRGYYAAGAGALAAVLIL